MNAIITGASRGLGRAIAGSFGVRGYNLYLTARQPGPLEETRSSLQSIFPQISIHAKAFDFSKSEEAKAFGHWILEQKIEIDVLINNAGQFIPGSIYNEAEGALELLMQVNLNAPYHLTRTLLPVMMARKAGHIFNICSIASFQAYPNGGAYSISKFALSGFSKNLREELKDFGIRVTAVYPGAAYTDSWAASEVDANRLMSAEDVASMIVAAAAISGRSVAEDIVLRPQLGDL
jgi:short-subunit dehydrogenase